MSDVKLPKQWRHWCKLAGLKSESHNAGKCSRGKWTYFSLIGFSRHWRVNCHATFDMSETFDTFDRWANSHELTMPMPKTKDEFLKTIKLMRGV